MGEKNKQAHTRRGLLLPSTDTNGDVQRKKVWNRRSRRSGQEREEACTQWTSTVRKNGKRGRCEVTGGSTTLLPNELWVMIVEMAGPLAWPACDLACRLMHGAARESSLKDEGPSWRPKRWIAEVAARGYMGVIKWARANGCPWDEWTCTNAAEGGHLEVLQWARANGCPWNSLTCACAAGGGHLEVLQWARANGCPWDEWTCRNAAGGGHLEVLQWARANGCPWDSFDLCSRCGRRTPGGAAMGARQRMPLG